MIASALENLRKTLGSRPAVSWGPAAWTYEQLATAGDRLAVDLAHLRGRKVGVCTSDVPLQLAVLLALDRLNATAVLFSHASSTEAIRVSSAELDVSELITQWPGDPAEWLTYPSTWGHRAESTPPESRGQVVLFTSGTSGRPKPALHTWTSLSAGVSQQSKHRELRWLLSYDISRFAGLQVLLQSLLTGGQLCVPLGRDPDSVLRCLKDDRVQCASGTPTFWRMLLGSATPEQLNACSLNQITLGGEAAEQGILEALAGAFPTARIYHIYASTEMGACFTVRDGRAGFPAAFLSDTTLPCRLQVADDGELMIRSSRAMKKYIDDEQERPDDWFGTGDIVRVDGDRVYFLGRKNECINVGGAKVYPADVEMVIRSVPGVRDVYVHRVESSLVGELVGAEVEADQSMDEAALRREILAVCRQGLAKFQVPAQLTFRTKLVVNESGKLARSRE